jgi:hypothetical protein
MSPISGSLFRAFEQHRDNLTALLKRRVEEVQLSSVAHDDKRHRVTESYGVRRPSDAYEGDVALRDLRAILARFDALGYERCALPSTREVSGPHASGRARRSEQQKQFHEAYTRACARVLYKDDWKTAAPAIMEDNGWARCPSEIMISTPRRFGKTVRALLYKPRARSPTQRTWWQFSVAMFCAAMALSNSAEICVFSETARFALFPAVLEPDCARGCAGPARRASRKILERMHEVCVAPFLHARRALMRTCVAQFCVLAGFTDSVLEYNVSTRSSNWTQANAA